MPDPKADSQAIVQLLKAIRQDLQKPFKNGNGYSDNQNNSLCSLLSPFNYWAWFTMSLLLTVGVKWLFHSYLANVGYINTFVGIALATWAIWVVLVVGCWLATSYRKKPYKDWTYRPRTLSDYLVVLLLIAIGLLLWTAFGPTKSEVNAYLDTLIGTVADNTPLGVVQDLINDDHGNSSNDTVNDTDGRLPANSTLYLDYCQQSLGWQKETCEASLGIMGLPLSATVGEVQAKVDSVKSKDSIPSDKPVVPESFQAMTDQQKLVYGIPYDISKPSPEGIPFGYTKGLSCKDCGYLETGEKRKPTMCDPLAQTWFGLHVEANFYVRAREDCYARENYLHGKPIDYKADVQKTTR